MFFIYVLYLILFRYSFRRMQKPIRKPVIVTTNIVRSRGRGAPAAPNPRYSNNANHSGNKNVYDGESRSFESRVQFPPGNRGRGQPLGRQGPPNHRQNNSDHHRQNNSDDDLQELSYKMSNVDLKSVKRTIIVRNTHTSM